MRGALEARRRATCAARGRQGPWGERARQREGKSQSRGTAVVQVDDCCVRASSFFGRKRFCGRQVPHAKIIKNVESRPLVRLRGLRHRTIASDFPITIISLSGRCWRGPDEIRSPGPIGANRAHAGCSETQPPDRATHNKTEPTLRSRARRAMSRSSARAVISAKRERTGKVHKKHHEFLTFGLGGQRW